jgi:putative ABC transport system permease protein
LSGPQLASARLLLRFALDGIRTQRGRSLLTMLGMAIGTASVVAVISIGLVGRDYVVGLIEGIGTNLVIAYGKDEGVNPEQVTLDDVDAIARGVPRIAALAPVLNDNQTLVIRQKPRSMRVLGTPPAFASVRKLVLVSGRFYSEREEAEGAKAAVVSRELARELFGTERAAGESIRVFGLRFPILGVYRESVESAAAVGQSEAAGFAVMIPFTTFRNLSESRWVYTLYVQAASRAAVPEVLAGLRGVLASRHRSIEGIEILSLDRYLALVDRVSDGLTLALLAVAGVSLLVGGIGIMNIMLVSVTERTRDIGIRLALGARRRDILMQFLIEAGVLSVAGGAAGLLLGAGLPWWAGGLYGVEVPISAAGAAVAFLVSLAVGLFFGLYPARRAAAMNLVDALGYE